MDKLSTTQSSVYDALKYIHINDSLSLYIATNWNTFIGLITIISSVIFVPFILPIIKTKLSEWKQNKTQAASAETAKHEELLRGFDKIADGFAQFSVHQQSFNREVAVEFEKSTNNHNKTHWRLERLAERNSGIMDAVDAHSHFMMYLTKSISDIINKIDIAFDDDLPDDDMSHEVEAIIAVIGGKLSTWLSKMSYGNHPPLSFFWGEDGNMLLTRYLVSEYYNYRVLLKNDPTNRLRRVRILEWRDRCVNRVGSMFSIWIDNYVSDALDTHKFVTQFSTLSTPLPTIYQRSAPINN